MDCGFKSSTLVSAGLFASLQRAAHRFASESRPDAKQRPLATNSLAMFIVVKVVDVQGPVNAQIS